MVISRKQGRMLLYACQNYEARNSRNSTNADHRTAKNNLELFLAGTQKAIDTRPRDMQWHIEWLNGENAYNGEPTWHGLYQQIDFALNY